MDDRTEAELKNAVAKYRQVYACHIQIPGTSIIYGSLTLPQTDSESDSCPIQKWGVGMWVLSRDKVERHGLYYTWVYSKEDTMAHTRRPVVIS